ncbi:glycosyltransferase family 9 protein [Geodermatophilus poikilotrophus]|uniref:ADP-heptose:LPS heptosyltransferase n=1 Tax=Geodermatophilus poikilotrophus TaxID=1333667 RepID=A0A1H9ZNJ6_9ACTN|nr:glycosyltransferase family 9 protein [Geodermatophilus poikilotrophus]SES83257.1 ADP-heptose:LPS heptosyltransferase [Geodermatophilus poikilotrophus]
MPQVTALLADPSVRRVALVRLRVGLGDLLCSLPALRRLRAARPDLAVSLVTWPETAAVVERMGDAVDELLPFPGADDVPDRPPGREPDPAAWAAFTAAAAERRFDLALQVYGDRPGANRVTAALGARLVGGFAPTGWAPPRGTEHLHLRYPLHLHEAERHTRLFEHLGLPPAGPPEMAFPSTPADEAEHAATLDRAGLVPGGYAVLHPGASSPTRRWPVERYAAVGDALAADGLVVVVTGGPGERAVGAAVVAAMRAPAVDLTGATSLGGLAALLRDAAVLVGNDTGTAHLAAAVGARSVTVFLPGDPVRWAHPGPRHRALVADVPCAPCPHLVCPIDFRCADSVRTRDVLAAARELVGAGA